jgi:hypothetical protein
MKSKLQNPGKFTLLFGVMLLVLTACGGGGGGGGGGAGGQKTGDDVADTLANLNVDTTPTDRVDNSNDPLPDSFTPIGKNKTLAKKSEIFLAGLGLASESDHVNILKFKPGVSNVPGVPDSPDTTTKLPTNPLDTSWKNDLQNASAAGDIDGDGFEEVILLWWDSSDDGIRLKIIDDEEEAFTESPVSVLTTATPTWLRVIAGDFDSDGTDDIVIAIADDNAGQITLSYLTGGKTSGYSIDAARDKTFSANETASMLGIELAVGQLDLDGGEELGVVVNEIWGSGMNQSPGFGTSYYHLYDDQSGNFAELTTARISGDVSTTTHNAVVGTIAMGDVDGDGMDEVVLAGLADSFPVQCDSPDSIAFVLDDAANGFTNLGTALLDQQNPNGGCESSANNSHIEHMWANTLDIDGDQYAEIQVNGVIYEDFANAAAPWDPMMVDNGTANPVIATVPFDYIYVAKTLSGRNDRNNTVFAVGDVTADGKEDILVYSPRQVDVGDITNGNITFDDTAYAVTVWGIDPATGLWGKNNITGSEGHIGMLYYERLFASHSGVTAGGPPQIVPANVDADSTMLKFSEGSHRVVFSEPIVHAALAAPPCYDDCSQITDECRTAWGKGTSTSVDASISHEITVKQHTGIEGDVSIPLVGNVGVEVEETVGVSLKAEASFGYQLTKTITYRTGPMEDTVVATVIPYDEYTYKILSHPVFPELVGKNMVISLPRTPRTMQLNRQFYNDSLVGDGVRIDSSVFSHVIGDVQSYPTRSDMLARTNAKSIGPVDVGASSGSTTVDISESKVAGFTTTLGVSYETTVKATGGKVMRGYTVGSTTEASLGFSVGNSVTFSGTVGEMPPATFSLDKAYSYGMFVYKQNPGSIQRPFQVINYWVE